MIVLGLQIIKILYALAMLSFGNAARLLNLWWKTKDDWYLWEMGCNLALFGLSITAILFNPQLRYL